jgi:WD40 repeat protein
MWSTDDYSIRIADLQWVGSVDRLSGHQGEVLTVAFSEDGEIMLTGSDDNTARLWKIEKVHPQEDTPTEEPVSALAKRAVRRCLTLGQRERYFLTREPPLWCIESGLWPYDRVEAMAC